MKKLLLILVCLLIPAYALADACVSDNTGDWDAPATWAACGGGFPEAADTAEILVGHTVTVKGTEAVGASPASIVTYNLDITGTLIFENAAADSILNVYSSIRVNSGGKIQIGTSGSPIGSPMNCAGSARLYMRTHAAAQKYKIFLDAGSIEAHGCSTYHGTDATLTRARIVSCAPDCTAGAVTVTLDRTHGWAASTAWAGDGIIFGIGGNEITLPAVGDDPEIITTWTTPGATTIGVTFTEDHMAGDIVEIVRRNVLIDSDSPTYHPALYTNWNSINDPYSMRYVMVNEFGDSYTIPAISMDDVAQTLGTMDYVAVVNAHDGAASGCFKMYAKSWTSFEGNTCFDAGSGGRGYMMDTDTRLDTPILEFKNNSSYGSVNGTPEGIYSTTTHAVEVDGFWVSHTSRGIYRANYNGAGVIKNCVINGITGDGIDLASITSYFPTSVVKVHDNEIRNCGSDGFVTMMMQGLFYNNDLDNIYRIGIHLKGQTGLRYHIRMHDNTYDNCNYNNWTAGAAVNIDTYAGTVHMSNEEFGQSAVNGFANILFYGGSTTGMYVKAVCSDCLLSNPDAGNICGVMPADGYFPFGCTGAGWDDVNRIGDSSTFTFDNKDKVEGAHLGWGPGGMVFSRQTSVNYTTSNLKMKITPCNSTAYSCLKVGSTYLNSGQAVTVDVYLRKDEAVATAGRRPRLALEGLGFVREEDYDEMSNVTDTWEKVTVTGSADWKGVVGIYVCVMGVMDGLNGYQPKWQPTLDIYADGASITK